MVDSVVHRSSLPKQAEMIRNECGSAAVERFDDGFAERLVTSIVPCVRCANDESEGQCAVLKLGYRKTLMHPWGFGVFGSRRASPRVQAAAGVIVLGEGCRLRKHFPPNEVLHCAAFLGRHRRVRSAGA